MSWRATSTRKNRKDQRVQHGSIMECGCRLYRSSDYMTCPGMKDLCIRQYSLWSKSADLECTLEQGSTRTSSETRTRESLRTKTDAVPNAGGALIATSSEALTMLLSMLIVATGLIAKDSPNSR
jgi:hypothetical protein